MRCTKKFFKFLPEISIFFLHIRRLVVLPLVCSTVESNLEGEVCGVSIVFGAEFHRFCLFVALGSCGGHSSYFSQLELGLYLALKQR